MTKTWLLVVLALLVPVTAVAQDEPAPPISAWEVLDTFPFDRMEDAPLNGIATVRLRLWSGWPEDEQVRETVALRLTRADDEEVDGTLGIRRDLGEVFFETAFPLAEGIEYTLHIELNNSLLGGGGVDETYQVQFTTGNRFDEAPPAFSGLQSLTVTELARAVNECCPANEEYCGGLPPARCQWCWIVDWEYVPQLELHFRAVEDEFGARSLRYLVYRVAGPDAPAEGAPRMVGRYDEAGDKTVTLTEPDPGPWCYHVQAVDVWDRPDGNTTVVCGNIDDLVAIDRLEVPPEDRSFCVDEGGEPGEDVGQDVPGDGDVAVGDDVGRDVGAEDEGPATVTNPPDSGCGCETPAQTLSWRWMFRR